MRTVVFALLFALVSLGAACSDAVGPAERALDGPWSTGHTTTGFDMAVNLTWTRDHVAGSGSYSAAADGARCGTTAIAGASSVTFAAARRGSSDVHGQVTFGGGAQIEYDGTLNDAQQSPGFARINGTLIAADGTRCSLTLFQGFVP